MHRSPVEDLAHEHGIEVLTPYSCNDSGFVARLKQLSPQCCPVVAYGKLLPKPVLEVPDHGWVNLHFSLLPAWRGAAPVHAAIRHGDDLTGATTFLLDEGMDTGPVFGMVTEAISPADTSGSLLGRLSNVGAGLLVATLDAIANGTTHPLPQPADGVSYAPKISGGDARVNWTHPAMAVDRQIRACTPEPGAWTEFNGSRLSLGPVTIDTDAAALPAGHAAITKAGVWVGTATSSVRLGLVQAPGKKPTPAADWARGLRVHELVLQ